MIEILTILILSFASPLFNDKPEQEIEDFYNWYLNGGREEVRVAFICSNQGYTTLNIVEVEQILLRHNISKKLVNVFNETWTNCLSSLSKLKFEEFQSIDDISGIEELQCDVQSEFWFANSFENPNEFKLENGKLLNQKTYRADVVVPSALLRFQVIAIKQNGKWVIDDIN